MVTEINKAAALTANWWSCKLQQGDKKKFNSEVYCRVLKELKEKGRCVLECDYDPRDLLLEAVRAIGIKCDGYMFSAEGVLPGKHSTVTTNDKIRCKEGYANWKEDIIVDPTNNVSYNETD